MFRAGSTWNMIRILSSNFYPRNVRSKPGFTYTFETRTRLPKQRRILAQRRQPKTRRHGLRWAFEFLAVSLKRIHRLVQPARAVHAYVNKRIHQSSPLSIGLVPASNHHSIMERSGKTEARNNAGRLRNNHRVPYLYPEARQRRNHHG